VERALAAAHGALAAEYASLRDAGLLFPETECIHDAAAGAWKHYSVNGYWLRLDANGCSLATPAACAVLAAMHALELSAPFQVVRAGYSVVDTDAHLQPHFGMTNAQASSLRSA
jgi:hypothetical protein